MAIFMQAVLGGKGIFYWGVSNFNLESLASLALLYIVVLLANISLGAF